MSSPTPPPRARRTQAERRAETRAALLAATIDCLVTYGYAQTTTGRIAEMAGVSRGAQIPYFRTRAELVSVAVVHLAEEREKAVHERFAGVEMTPEQALDVLWEEHQGPVYDAALELWVASRTDPDLRATLQDVERDVGMAIGREAKSALGEAARRPGFADDLNLALATIRGLALLRISSGESAEVLSRRWERSRERLVRLLSEPA
jgi:AcrR family transcriptional regulator